MSRVHAIFSIAIFLLSALSVNLTAQEPSRLLKKADSWLNAYNYSKALKAYTQLEKRGESLYYVTLKIAECHRLLDQPIKAVEWYQKATAFPDVEKETYYHLGKELEKLKRYKEAEENIARYRSLSGQPDRINGLSNEEYLLTLKQDADQWNLSHLKINTPLSEFGPTIYNDQLIFTSNRTERTIISRHDVRNRQPFFDLYTATILDFASLAEPTPFAPNIWSALNDGPVAFSPNGLDMFVTVNVQKGNKQEEQNLDIVVYNLSKGEWPSKHAYLPLREEGYSIMHPALSKDGSRLYFASDMPNGYGGIDLYYSEQRDGFLSSPVNLGPSINTPGNEVFPFITREGDLYFASDGHPGLGGLDIFLAQKEGSSFSTPFNVGADLNSAFDDFSLCLFPNEREGFFASNRPGGSGNDDLYAFQRSQKLRFIPVTGIVIDKTTGEPAPDTYITLSVNGLKAGEWVTASDGKFNFYLKTDHEASITCMKRLFITQEKKVSSQEMSGLKKMEIKIIMDPR